MRIEEIQQRYFARCNNACAIGVIISAAGIAVSGYHAGFQQPEIPGIQELLEKKTQAETGRDFFQQRRATLQGYVPTFQPESVRDDITRLLPPVNNEELMTLNKIITAYDSEIAKMDDDPALKAYHQEGRDFINNFLTGSLGSVVLGFAVTLGLTYRARKRRRRELAELERANNPPCSSDSTE